MKLKIKLGKAEYDALEESLKSLYVAEGDDFKLDADYEDVSGLKAKRDELLAEVKKQKAIAEQFEGLDPAKVKEALASIDQAETDKLTKKGEWDTLKKQLEDRHKSEIEAEQGKYNGLLTTLKQAEMKNLLTSRGIMPDRLKAAIAEGDFDNLFELKPGENGFSLAKKDGIGDAAEMDTIFAGFKEQAPYLFTGNDASGSGASGSQGAVGADLNKMSPIQLLDMANSQAK